MIVFKIKALILKLHLDLYCGNANIISRMARGEEGIIRYTFQG
ncbi:MAG: hypothetical protein HPY66_2041 [Firmicutes bacterium]|nr:hypothetical protein [Bacillota bacterium]